MFPYAIISPNMTAAELHDRQPWLYRMIMMAVSSHERHKQVETGKLLISEIFTAVSDFSPLILFFFPEIGSSSRILYDFLSRAWKTD